MSIAKALKLFPAEVESMEGAAFFYVCLSEGVKCVQLRSISNYVERRNRESWNIPLAIKNLNAELKRLTDRYIQIK
ncbi:Futalosine hydrolase [compost metagenome]